MGRTTTIFAFALVMWGIFTGHGAAAESCGQLRSELYRLDRAGGGSRVALDGQTAATLQHLRGQANRLRCNGFLSVPTDPKRCKSISERIRHIETRSRLASLPAQLAGKRKRIEARLGTLGCGGKKPSRAGKRKKVPDSGGRRPGKGDAATRPAQASKPAQSKADRQQAAAPATRPGFPRSNLRTVCVRLCDGYYFPISFGRGARSFPADEKMCKARCPGAATRLYYQSLAEGSSEEMRAVDDDSLYEDLPGAFRYRNRASSRPGCSCRIARVTETGGAQAPEPVPANTDITANQIEETSGTGAEPAAGPDDQTSGDVAQIHEISPSTPIRIIGVPYNSDFLEEPEQSPVGTRKTRAERTLATQIISSLLEFVDNLRGGS